MNPFGVDSHDVSKAARFPGPPGRPVRRTHKYPKGNTGKAKDAALGGVVGTAAGAAARWAAPAAVGVATGAAGGIVGTDAWQDRKRKLRRVQTIDGVSKAMAGGKPITEERLRRRKAVQGGLGMTAAGLSTAAFGLKSTSMTLPKLIKAPAKANRYKNHLDDAATKILFGAAGVGGASGLHQSRVYQLEGKKPVRKAYDPEKRRLRRLKAYEGAAAGGAVAGAAGAGVGARARGRQKAARAATEQRNAAGAARASAQKAGNVRAAQLRVRRMNTMADTLRTRAGEHDIRSRAYEQRASALGAGPARERSANIRNATNEHQRGSRAMRASRNVEAAANKVKPQRVTFTPERLPKVLPKGVVVAAGAAGAASAGTAAGLHHYRTRGAGRPYGGWYDGKRRRKTKVSKAKKEIGVGLAGAGSGGVVFTAAQDKRRKRRAKNEIDTATRMAMSTVRKRIDTEPDWVRKAMPDQADLHVHGATANRRKKRPRPITAREAKVSYC